MTKAKVEARGRLRSPIRTGGSTKTSATTGKAKTTGKIKTPATTGRVKILGKMLPSNYLTRRKRKEKVKEKARKKVQPIHGKSKERFKKRLSEYTGRGRK